MSVGLDILGGLCSVVSIVFMVIPILSIIEVFRTRNITRIPYLLYIFTILNCEFWMIYGFKIQAWPVYLCNAIGVVSNIFFMTVFLYYLQRELWVRVLFMSLLIGGFIISFVLIIIYIESLMVIGIIALIMNVIMTAMPLQRVRQVFREKDNSYIPIHSSICLLVSGALWVAYGVLSDVNVFIIIPNALAIGLSIFQIVLWVVFRKSEEERLNEEPENLNLVIDDDKSSTNSGDIMLEQQKLEKDSEKMLANVKNEIEI